MKRTIIIIAAMSLLAAQASYAGQLVKPVLACHIANVLKEPVPAEGNKAINEARLPFGDHGAFVYIYLHNRSDKPVTVANVSWDGADIKEHLGGPKYELLWWRSAPNPMAPGAECEITLCLRESLKKDTKFTIDLGDAGKTECVVNYRYPGPKLNTVSFSSDMRSAYLYADRARGAFKGLYVDGVSAGASAKMLGGKDADGLAVIKYTPAKPFAQGKRHVFRALFGDQACGASIRAFGDVARFGTYGENSPKTYADAGIDFYASFGTLDEKTLNQYGSYGIKTILTLGFKNPEPYMIANPNVFGYLAVDEPDNVDYSKGADRPMALRIGTVAQRLVDWSDACEKVDPSKATVATLDLTFVPQNYFTYGKAVDIGDPDCYTVVCGWPVTVFRDKMMLMKRASAPQPFFSTYQSDWEEFGTAKEYVGGAQLEQGGPGAFVDKSRIRGFGRAPSPEEVRIMILYTIGAGGHGLVSFFASHEGGELVYHGGPILPEVWEAMTTTHRELRVVAPLVQIANPTDWCKSDKGSLWTKTLVCGERACLVVAVNEACKSEKDGFVSSPVRDASFSFADLPWLKGTHVYKVGDGKMDSVEVSRKGKSLSWKDSSIADGEMYLVCADASLASELVAQYNSKLPHATEDGKRRPAEGYLKGRRRTQDIK